jgi:NAD-dependent DNA ligase
MNAVISSPFKDKHVILIGRPTRCTRAEAKHELEIAGGTYSRSVTSYVKYAVLFRGAEETVLYNTVKKWSDNGHLVMLNEDEFWDILVN